MAGVGQCGSLKVRKCANPCVFTVNRVRGGAKASGVRRCVRSGLGAVSARGPSNSGHSFSLKFWCVQLYWGKQLQIARRNGRRVQSTGSSHLNSSVTWHAWDNVQG